MEEAVCGPGGKLAALTAKVGPKGQIVIPKDIRAMFGIEPGDTVLVLADVERGIAVTPVKGNEALFAQLFGGAFPVASAGGPVGTAEPKGAGEEQGRDGLL